jgi:formylglycine-generating enzyme required for sulfatase activity
MKVLIPVLLIVLIMTGGQGWAADPPTISPTEEVLIPAGEFIMGRADSGDELTPHPVKLDAFYIDKHEVTNAQYHAFCEATDTELPVFWGLDRFRCSLDYPDHPVVGVSQAAAQKYAEWVGRRLPTEAEWEYAARGGLERLSYGTADVLEDDEANTKSAKLDGPVAVGSFEPNGYGVYDMVGNVREWVADYYSEDYFANSPVDNPQGPEKTRWRVIKGGGWYSGKSCNMVHVRNALPGSWSDFNVGFRCARDAD